MKTVRIGSGAGYGGDRLDPALELLERGGLDYIGFECLAERTIALAQKEKLEDPARGYNPLLEYRMEQVLPLAWKNRVKVITNMGAANPEAAAGKCREIAARHGLAGMKIAAVCGDDILPLLTQYEQTNTWEFQRPLAELGKPVISANAYLGADGIVAALRAGADVVITGRVSDPALFLAPMIYEFDWAADDWGRLGRGTLCGHLLECGGQVCGGYFADPGKKDVPGLEKLGFPIAEVTEEGDITITKVPGSGGIVTRETCMEQTLYEIHDPTRYLTPDVVADFSGVQFTQAGEDRVLVQGASGTARPEALKVSVGYDDGYIGCGEISYGGINCVARAELAAEILKKRLELRLPELSELRVDLLGINSLFASAQIPEGLREVRVRVSGRSEDRRSAEIVGEEVEALYTNGPAGGGGAEKRVTKVISVASILVPRDAARPRFVMMEVGA